MASLIHTNAYLKSPLLRERMLVRNVFESSVFEGARGLRVGRPARVLRTKASAKKRASKS
jgi:hypothetical protein